MKKIQKNAARFDNLKQDFLDDKKYSGTAEATLNGYRYDVDGNFTTLIFGQCGTAFVDSRRKLIQCHFPALPKLPDLVSDLNTDFRHSSPPKSPFSLHRNRITLLIEILLDLKPNVNFCEKMSCVFQTKTAYITNDAGGFLGGVKRKSKKC